MKPICLNLSKNCMRKNVDKAITSCSCPQLLSALGQKKECNISFLAGI